MCQSALLPVSDTGPNYVVGLGASAGGLEALQGFFDAMPPDTGMAFVVIQHLSADYKSVMDELLQKHTQMPVQVVRQPVPLAPNRIYLNTSQAHLGLKDGMLILWDKEPEQRLHFPIDSFFQALGEQIQERSAGLIFSGTGTDGSRGVTFIKEHQGLVMVQAPEEARFDGMPNAVIHLGLADFVCPVAELAANLARLGRQRAVSERSQTQPDTLATILQRAAQASRVDFTLYCQERLLRRLHKRMRILNQPDLEAYSAYLMAEADESLRLAREFLMGVPRFFRDEAVWQVLENKVLPALCQGAGPDGLRCWVAGCASGEEAYSLAMLIQDCLDRHRLNLDFNILATDLDEAALAFARQGSYPEAIFVNMGTERLRRYFEKTGDSYQVKKKLSERIIFTRHNLLSDPPFLKQDLILCRNVLVYFHAEALQQVFQTLYAALHPSGLLLLGNTERADRADSLFEGQDPSINLFRRRNRQGAPLRDGVALPAVSLASEVRAKPAIPGHPATDERFFEEVLLSEYVPATVFVSLEGEILYAHGQTYPFMMFPRGRVSYHFDTMLNPAEAALIRRGMQRVLQTRETLVYQAVELQREQGLITADIRLRAFWHPGQGNDVILLEFTSHEARSHTETLTRVTGAGDFAQEQLQALYHEIKQKDYALQSLRDKLETSYEELQASNEALQVSNEELQTSNEELQSVNEELYTVNAELGSKIVSLAELNNDLTNFLNSTEIGLVFLDRDFCIRKFTPAICQALNLYESDIGRSVAHFATRFDQAVDLVRAAADVLKTDHIHEQALSIAQSQEFLLRILPYRTLENKTQGVVLTLFDVTEINRVRRRANLMNARYQTIFDNIPDYVMLLNGRGEILLANQYFQSQLGSEAQLKSLAAAFGGSHTSFMACLQEAERSKGAIALMTQLKSPLSTRCFSHHFCVLPAEDGAESQFILVTRDVSELRAYQVQIQNQASKLQGLIDSSQDLIAAIDKDYRLIVCNQAYQRFLAQYFGLYADEHFDFLAAFEGLNKAQQSLYNLLLGLWERALGGAAFETEAELRLPDGSNRHFQLSFAPLITPSGELLGVSHTLRDISAAREAEVRLRQTLDELERTNAYLDSFVYAAAHDLRSPVANLLSLVERIKIREPLPAESLFPFLEQSVHSLDHTLNGLIEIIDTQKQSDEKAHWLDVKACFESLFADYPQLKPEQIELQLTAEAERFGYLPAYFRSILQNLIDNAVKYQAPERPLQLKIRVSRSAADTLALQVQDNGQGLPERLVRDKLFKAFQRFHPQHTGKGIGLYLVKTLAEKNGGWVDVLETQGPGTCFILELKEYECRDEMNEARFDGH